VQTALHDRPDLVDSLIHTGLEDAQETLMDVFDEMEGQLDKEMNRIEELVGPGGKMETDPGAFPPCLVVEKTSANLRTSPLRQDSFFMIESEPALENVDIQTDATGTTAGSMFTRYTVARSATASAWSGRSRDSSSSRRKAKKKILGRKGTVGEWEYLVASLGRLADRVEEKTSGWHGMVL
jgi:elongator complex protein 1